MITDFLDDDIRLTLPETGISYSNPFPGLRSFEITESHLFFGQDQLTDQVLDKLKENRFVCLLGGSGVGKTSLINAAIKPALFSGIVSRLNQHWHIFHLQPGNNPILNLARCISKSKKVEFFDEDQHLREQVCYNILKRGRQGLVELISQITGEGDEEFLFIVDQFEDLFRLQARNNSYSLYEEASQYVDLFLEALNKKSIKIQMIISIRSDFTDDCILFPSLSELINKSNIIVPKMNRDQIQETILGPLRIFKVQVEESLLSKILNDASSTEDVLPRLQHAMHRTWKSWLSQSNIHKPITLKEYEASGGIGSSISMYANSIYDLLNDADKFICENIFKALSERGSENKGLTRSVMLNELAAISKSDVTEVRSVINLFRSQDAKFIQVEGADLKPDAYISLVHVSLIRSWDRLKSWVEDEAISGQMYKQLAESSSAYLMGKSGLLRPPDLNFALNWKEKQKPNLNWAKRYNPAFERTMVYLSTSHETFQAEEELKHLQATKAQKKVRSLFVVLGGTIIIALGLTILAQFSKTRAQKQRLIAIEQSKEALMKSEKAEMLSKEAFEDKIRAEYAANESEKARQEVEEKSKILVEQKQVAELTAQEALKKTVETEQSNLQLSRQKQNLEENAFRANLQKTEAEKEKDATFQKRMVTAAQALAVKSTQIQGNKVLKALLSVHAFRFNKMYNGPEIQPDIYNSLLSAASDLGISYRLPLNAHSGAVNALCIYLRTNTVYSTGSDGKIYSWNIQENTPSPKLIAGSSGRNLSIAVSQNGKWLATGNDIGVIRLIDLSNLSNIVELRGHKGAVFSLAFSRDALQLFSTSSDKNVFLWDIASQKKSAIENDANLVRVLTVSSDGRFLAGGTDDGRILLWDIKSNQMTVIFSENSNPIYSLAFNTSGMMLASGDVKGNIKLWNPYSRKLVRNLKSHSARVVDIKFSQSGDFMITSSYDKSAYIFDTKFPANPPDVIREPSAYIMSAVFSSNNQRVILATEKGENLVIWPSNSEIVAGYICPKLNRNLTNEEWAAYIGSDIKYDKPCE